MSDVIFRKRKREIERVLWLTLLLNVGVACAKLVYGQSSKTLSMVADGYHSLFDSISNIVGLVALAFTKDAEDPNAPHSHPKIEAIAAMAISVMLFIACYEIVSSAYQRYLSKSIPDVTLYSFLIMLLSIFINIGVSRYENRRGKELNSQILTADAAHTRSDIFGSVSVLIALIGVKYKLPYVDVITALLIAILVGYSGYKIIIESLNILMNGAQTKPRKHHH